MGIFLKSSRVRRHTDCVCKKVGRGFLLSSVHSRYYSSIACTTKVTSYRNCSTVCSEKTLPLKEPPSESPKAIVRVVAFSSKVPDSLSCSYIIPSHINYGLKNQPSISLLNINIGCFKTVFLLFPLALFIRKLS